MHSLINFYSNHLIILSLSPSHFTLSRLQVVVVLVVVMPKGNIVGQESVVHRLPHCHQQLQMPLLTQSRLPVTQHFVLRNELFQEFHVAVVQDQVLVSTNRTGVASGYESSADARLPRFLRGEHSLVISPVQGPHGTVPVRLLVRTALHVLHAGLHRHRSGPVNWNERGGLCQEEEMGLQQQLTCAPNFCRLFGSIHCWRCMIFTPPDAGHGQGSDGDSGWCQHLLDNRGTE